MDADQARRAAEIKSGVTHDSTTYLKRISDNIEAMAKQFTKLFEYIDRAESKVPEEFRRLSMVYHDMHDAKNAYVELGLPTPTYIDRAIELFDDAMRQAIKDLETEGGHFYRARQEIVKHGDYRYDHNTPLLAAKHKEPTT